jgi:hypothetical protein
MRILLLLLSLLLFSVNASAADETADAANKAKFEKECAAMIAPGAPCGDVKAGGGGRRGCVAKPENITKATPACKLVVDEWTAMKK